MNQLDITQEVCPMTYVRVKLRVEALADGELLEVRLKGSEPLKNVPRSARDDGHEVVSLVPTSEDPAVHLLTLRVHHP